MPEKILLGKVHNDFAKDVIAGENIYLTAHSWDCGWYWGFGYIGNRELHTHFDSSFLGAETNVKKIFSHTNITQDEWWILRDLFIQAYALKKCAEVYRHGGYQTTKKGITDIIVHCDMANKINADLKKVLDKIWEVVSETTGRP